jgi:cellulose synthase/poly-beta-1,6-N-acetylglucosamine synthase-like glycosyltransferase
MPSEVTNSSYTSAGSAATRSLASAQPGSHAQQKLALTIPTLREADNIPGLLHRVRAALDLVGIDYEILVVDDDSRDGTEELVSAIALEDPRQEASGASVARSQVCCQGRCR